MKVPRLERTKGNNRIALLNSQKKPERDEAGEGKIRAWGAKTMSTWRREGEARRKMNYERRFGVVFFLGGWGGGVGGGWVCFFHREEEPTWKP